jgi:hypothetical protein
MRAARQAAQKNMDIFGVRLHFPDGAFALPADKCSLKPKLNAV